MAVISDTSREFEKVQALRRSLHGASSVNRSGRVFLGAVLVISALGLWLVPVSEGDAGMKLIKLLISLVLLGLGAMFLSSIDARKDAPEIQVDTQARELRVLRPDAAGQMTIVAVYNLDGLSDVTLKDKLLTAHGPEGELVVSLPVADKHTENALRGALLDAS